MNTLIGLKALIPAFTLLSEVGTTVDVKNFGIEINKDSAIFTLNGEEIETNADTFKVVSNTKVIVSNIWFKNGEHIGNGTFTIDKNGVIILTNASQTNGTVQVAPILKRYIISDSEINKDFNGLTPKGVAFQTIDNVNILDEKIKKCETNISTNIETRITTIQENLKDELNKDISIVTEKVNEVEKTVSILTDTDLTKLANNIKKSKQMLEKAGLDQASYLQDVTNAIEEMPEIIRLGAFTIPADSILKVNFSGELKNNNYIVHSNLTNSNSGIVLEVFEKDIRGFKVKAIDSINYWLEDKVLSKVDNNLLIDVVTDSQIDLRGQIELPDGAVTID